MCGIVGYAGPGVRIEEGSALLRRMCGAIAHRGPDGEGVHAGIGFGFGHRRLAVVDLSANGAQPMASADGTAWITYNGEIFNHPELRAMLEARGRLFRSTCDTEVVLQLYQEFGLDFVDRLNGDFALAIWDERARRLVLARDRMGVRPLFHATRGGSFHFASEVKALLQVPGIEAEIDPLGLDQIFTLWAPIAPRTAFRGISELPPGHLMVVEGGAARAWPYWTLEFPEQANDGDPRGEARIAEELRHLLEDATRIRLRADVEVGSFLSGGLDSSAISALAARLAPAGLQTFGVGFADPAFDESGFQATMARALGTTHHSIRCGETDIAEIFPDVVRHAEQPMLRSAPAPLFRLSGLVRASGLKVVLTGEGADEIFAGYDLFKEAQVRRFCARQPNSAIRPHLFRRLYPYLASLNQQSPAYLARFFGIGSDDPNDPLFSHRPRMRSTRGAKLLYSGDLRAALGDYDAAEELAASLPAAFGTWHPLHQAQYLETRLLLPGYLLSAQGDRMAMAHGIETRFPFLDHRLVAFAAGIPPRLKLRGLREKHILRTATADLLPVEIAERPKQPYRAPDSASFRGPAGTGPIEAMSEAAVDAAGLFDARATQHLLDKHRRGPLDGFRDNTAFMGVLSTQLWVEAFCARPARSAVQPAA
jgi:asparagine synthase (glutamine-hydrolysing)